MDGPDFGSFITQNFSYCLHALASADFLLLAIPP
jgi:hypothetical protein